MTPEQEYDLFTELLWRELHPEQGRSAADCRAHNPEVGGSNPPPASNLITLEPDDAENWQCPKCQALTSTMLTRCYTCDTPRPARNSK